MQDNTLRTGRDNMVPFLYVPTVTLIVINHLLSRDKNADGGNLGQYSASLFFGDVGVALIYAISPLTQGIAKLFVLPFCIKSDTLFFCVTVSTFMVLLNGVIPCLLRKLSFRIVKYSVNPINQLFSTKMLFVFVGTLKGISHGCPFPFGGGTPQGRCRIGESFCFLCQGRGKHACTEREVNPPHPHPPVPSRRTLFIWRLHTANLQTDHTPAPLKDGVLTERRHS